MGMEVEEIRHLDRRRGIRDSEAEGIRAPDHLRSSPGILIYSSMSNSTLMSYGVASKLCYLLLWVYDIIDMDCEVEGIINLHFSISRSLSRTSLGIKNSPARRESIRNWKRRWLKRDTKYWKSLDR